MNEKPSLTIIGGGMGSPALLTAPAREATAGAGTVLAPPRLALSLGDVAGGVTGASIDEMRAILRRDAGDTAVIVSGDVGFHSLARSLVEEFGDRYAVRCLSGLSSLQVLCARLSLPWDDVKTVSLHGKDGGLTAAVSYHPKVFALTGGAGGVRRALEALCGAGLGHLSVSVGENLSSPEERVVTATADELLPVDFSPLAVLLVRNPAPADPNTRLRDEDFERGAVPMTKEAARCLAVARLEVRPGDTVWDIGAGTGAMSVALAYRATEGRVFAVERSPQAVELVRRNRGRFGAYNLTVAEAPAPEGLESLPDPDRVFVGGSGGRLPDILAAVTARSVPFTVCVNAIALESVAAALDALKQGGFSDIETACVNLSTAREAGAYHIMTAQNPVYILSGRWRP